MPGLSNSSVILIASVVMDGEDLADYDDFGAREEQDEADTEALNQLEWELASQDGRITGTYCLATSM